MIDKALTYFEIKEGTDFIKVNVIKQNFPDAELDWDKNSLNCQISVKCGGFTGNFNSELMSTDFDLFQKELEIAYKTLDRSATFEGIESQIIIRMEGDGIGHFNAKCHLMDSAGIGNELTCEFEVDQTQIPELIKQLNNITSEYPVYR